MDAILNPVCRLADNAPAVRMKAEVTEKVEVTDKTRGLVIWFSRCPRAQFIGLSASFRFFHTRLGLSLFGGK